MQKIMQVVFGNDWILKDIFLNAKVTAASAEIEMLRLLTFEEEKRLFDANVVQRETIYTRIRKNGKQEVKTATIKVDNSATAVWWFGTAKWMSAPVFYNIGAWF